MPFVETSLCKYEGILPKTLFEETVKKVTSDSSSAFILFDFDGFSKIKDTFGNTKSEEIVIFTGSGINVDQSEDKLKAQIPQDKKLLEAFWVRVNEEVKKLEEPYITVLIYENKSALSQNQAQEDIE